jgi:CRISPR-associated protein Cas2
MTKQFLVISYDISDDKRRLKVMKTLQDYGARVQYSVFECRLLPNQVEKLKRSLRPFVREANDSIRFYYINLIDVGRIEVLGSGGVTQDHTFYMQ